MTRDDLAAWKDNPATQWVMEALELAAQAQEQGWHDMAWEAGKCDPLTLVELRTRADAYRAIEQTSYERFCDMRGESPEADEG